MHEQAIGVWDLQEPTSVKLQQEVAMSVARKRKNATIAAHKHITR